MGIGNIHSSTQAKSKFLLKLNAHNYNKIIISLREVDTAYTIWEHIKRNNATKEELLAKATQNYQDFLKLLTSYAPVVVLSAPLPTLNDTSVCDDNLTGIRRKVDVTQKERTELTLAFNQSIKKFCKNQTDIYFMDLDHVSLSKSGTVVKWLLNPINKCDHHYNPYMYALLLVWRFKMLRKM